MAPTTTPVALSVRPARPDDLPRLTALLDRCTPESLYRRFHGATGTPARRELARVAEPDARHRSWLAVAPDGTVRGVGTLAWARHGGHPEVALLVEDAWFRRGVGRALARRLAVAARGTGSAGVSARIQADNLRAVRFLRAVAPGARLDLDGGELAAAVPLSRAGGVRRDGEAPDPGDRTREAA